MLQQETKLKDAVAAFKEEINRLTRLVEAGAGLAALDHTDGDDLQRRNEELEREQEVQVWRTGKDVWRAVTHRGIQHKHKLLHQGS
jgi:uncharacterized protein YjdB